MKAILPFLMLTYPQIDPVAISLGPISVHWYGIMYITAFGVAWVLATYRAARVADPWTAEQISDEQCSTRRNTQLMIEVQKLCK